MLETYDSSMQAFRIEYFSLLIPFAQVESEEYSFLVIVFIMIHPFWQRFACPLLVHSRQSGLLS